MFRYIPISDFLELGSASSDSEETGFDNDRILSLPVSKFWRSQSVDDAYVQFALTDTTAVPNIFAAINTRAFRGQYLDVMRGATVDDSEQDKFPWNRIQVAEFVGRANATWRLRFRDASSIARVWQCGYVIAANAWRTAELPESVNVSSYVPQLHSDAETATPILSRPAGKKRTITVTWIGDLADEQILNVFELFDEMEDRNEVSLIQPSTWKPYYFFGRLERWGSTGSGNNPETLTGTFSTDGLGQQVVS